MKQSRRIWFVIAAGAFVIALAVLGAAFSGKVDQQNELEKQLTQTRSNLNRVQPGKLSSQQAKLEKQLNEAISQFESVKATLSQPPGSIAIPSMLFDIAKDHGLKVTEVTTPGPASDSLEEVTFSILPITTTVEGDIPNLVSFVTELNRSIAAGVVKSITVTIPETTSGDKPKASIQLVIYTYQGG